MADDSQPMKPVPQVKDILEVFLGLLRRSGLVLGLLAGGLALANLLLGLGDRLVFGEDRPNFGLLSFTLLALPFFVGAAVHRVLWDWVPDLPEALDVAAMAYLQMLGVMIVTRILISLGFALLILPGFLAILFLTLAPVIIIAEGPGIARAVGESAQRISRIFVPVLLAYLVFAIGMLVAAFVVSIFLTIVSAGSGLAINAGVSAVFSICHVVFAVAIYLALQGRSGPQPATLDA